MASDNSECKVHIHMQGPGDWRHPKTEAGLRNSVGLIAQGGGKWGPMGLGAAAAWPMSRRPLEELVTALRKVASSSAAVSYTHALCSGTLIKAAGGFLGGRCFTGDML